MASKRRNQFPPQVRLAPQEFDLRVKIIGTRSTSVPAARAVLVEGATYLDACATHRVNQGAVCRMVRRIKTLRYCQSCLQELPR